MPETTDITLMESLSEALETMAFMMVMEPDEELDNPEQSVHVTMRFAGHFDMIPGVPSEPVKSKVGAQSDGGDVVLKVAVKELLHPALTKGPLAGQVSTGSAMPLLFVSAQPSQTLTGSETSPNQ